MIKGGGGSHINNYKLTQKNSDVNVLNTTNQTTYATGSDTTATTHINKKTGKPLD